MPDRVKFEKVWCSCVVKKQGSFSVPTDGLWSFSFNAGYVLFYFLNLFFSTGYGYITLKVDGTTVARSLTELTNYDFSDDNDSWMVKKMEPSVCLITNYGFQFGGKLDEVSLVPSF